MCYSIAKYLFFIFNFVFWLFGAAALGIGIWLFVDDASQVEIAGVDVYIAGAAVLIVAGAIMLVVGFFGCCGAIKESTCLLGTYFGFLFVILALEVSIGIYAIVEYDSLEETISGAMNNTFAEMNDEGDQESQLVQTQIATQQNMACCGGSNGCSDWNDLFGSSSQGCGCFVGDQSQNEKGCRNPAVAGCNPDRSDTVDTPTGVYTETCTKAVYTSMEDNIFVIGIVALCIGLAEILGMIVSMCLCCSIKDKKKKGEV